MSFKKGEVVIYNNEARIVEKVDKISIDGLGGEFRNFAHNKFKISINYEKYFTIFNQYGFCVRICTRLYGQDKWAK